MSGLSEQEITELLGKPQVPRSVERTEKMQNSQIQAFEETLFACTSVNETRAIADDIRKHMLSGDLTGSDLVVTGQMLIRAERQGMNLAGLEPDAAHYLDTSSSTPSDPAFKPTDEQLAEVERLNAVRDRENNVQQFRIDASRERIPPAMVNVHAEKYLASTDSELPTMESLHLEVADVNRFK